MPEMPLNPFSDESPFQPGDNAQKIPKAVIKRLSLYNRILQKLSMSSVEKVLSKELGEALGLNSAQVRKDLAYFGQFGVPGLGYYVEDLRSRLKAILGTDRVVRLGLVGVGNLGQALLAYTTGFQRDGFRTVAAFDSDKRKVGGDRNGVPVFHTTELAERIREMAIDIIILAVPPGVAQQVTADAIAAGITAILNFVPERLVVPPHVKVHYVDFSIEIESLSYYLK
jgi:redox-sensing transcriptional repressor